MPSFMSLFGYKVYFWSQENDPLEPIHVHVSENFQANATKIWLLSDGTCRVDQNRSKVPEKILKRIIENIEAFPEKVEELWLQHFGEITYIDKIVK